ncbi:MAG: sigma-70 family RNA polymerase sigma factor [Bacteroidetes bacterium]|nr:MAG: sigma-70 family RNA polymerase sigma factor [Bacteroidota bacterium]
MSLPDDGELYTQLKPVFFRLFQSWGLAKADMEDLYHEAFMAYLEAQAAGRYQAKQAVPAAYIYGCGRFILLKQRKVPFQYVPLDLQALSQLVSLPEKEADLAEQAAWLRSLIDKELDGPSRSLLRQYYWEGKPLDDIAKSLHASLGAIKMRKQRIIKKLFARFRSLFPGNNVLS